MLNFVAISKGINITPGTSDQNIAKFNFWHLDLRGAETDFRSEPVN